MSTITMNCERINWIDIGRTDLEVCFSDKDGWTDSVTLSKWDCENDSTDANLYYLVEEIEQKADILPEADRLYLEQKLWDTIARWSRDDDDIYI